MSANEKDAQSSPCCVMYRTHGSAEYPLFSTTAHPIPVSIWARLARKEVRQTFEVPHLDARDGEVGNLELDSDRSSFVQFLCTPRCQLVATRGLKEGETHHHEQKEGQSALA